MSSKILRNLFFGVGILLFGALLYNLGWDNLLKALRQIGWWWVALLAMAITWQACHTLAWHHILRFSSHRLPFFRLFRLKIVAEAVNMIAPSANIGGETARVFLIKKDIPTSDGISSVVVDKTLDNVTKLLFNALGLLLSVLFIPIPDAWVIGSLIYLFIALLFAIALIWVQVKGITGWVSNIGGRIPRVKRWLEKQRQKLESLDGNFKDIYARGLPSLAIATLWHLVGRTLGMLEIWLIMHLLGAPVTLLEAFFIATVANIAMGALFLIPGQWGALEYVQLLLVKLIGFTPEIGASLAVIRRIRRVALTGLGLAFFYLFKNEVPIKKAITPQPNPPDIPPAD
ncbi:MAG: TIGR00374 family protein [Bacteroidetes bacterium]|nr:MAG: TIGR00374 family protein [Bacteroidota bacterium]